MLRLGSFSSGLLAIGFVVGCGSSRKDAEEDCFVGVACDSDAQCVAIPVRAWNEAPTQRQQVFCLPAGAACSEDSHCANDGKCYPVAEAAIDDDEAQKICMLPDAYATEFCVYECVKSLDQISCGPDAEMADACRTDLCPQLLVWLEENSRLVEDCPPAAASFCVPECIEIVPDGCSATTFGSGACSG